MLGKSLKLFMALRIAEKRLGIDIYKALGGTATDRTKKWKKKVIKLIKPELNAKELALFLTPEFAFGVAEDLIKRRRVEHQVSSWANNGEVRVSIAREFLEKTNLSNPNHKPLITREDELHPLI